MYGAAIPTRVKRVSCRQRQREHAAAIFHAHESKTLLYALIIQAGGEIVLDPKHYSDARRRGGRLALEAVEKEDGTTAIHLVENA